MHGIRQGQKAHTAAKPLSGPQGAHRPFPAPCYSSPPTAPATGPENGATGPLASPAPRAPALSPPAAPVATLAALRAFIPARAAPATMARAHAVRDLRVLCGARVHETPGLAWPPARPEGAGASPAGPLAGAWIEALCPLEHKEAALAILSRAARGAGASPLPVEITTVATFDIPPSRPGGLAREQED